MRRFAILAASLMLGCASKGDDDAIQQAHQAIAMAGPSDDVLVVAFTTDDHADRLPDILDGQQPKEFRWVTVSVASAKLPDVRSPDGYMADLADSTAGVTFSQVYQSPCNPAAEINSPCWILESYRAGEPGLTGTAYLRLTDQEAIGHFEVMWQGWTDRFGPPTQRLRIGTSVGYQATLKDDAQ